MKTTRVALDTELSIRDAANVVNAVFAKLRADVAGIHTSSNPLDQLDGVADIAVVGQRATMTSMWAVQVYLYDMGDTCGVELVALGEGALTRAFRGFRNTASLTRSAQKLDLLVAALRARDPRAQLMG
jgi:hypothetical protein